MDILKYSRRHLLIVFGLISVGAHVAQADFVCTAEVLYRWKKQADGKDEFSTFWGTHTLAAATEEGAKAAAFEAAKISGKAAKEYCLSRHENLSGCIANKFAKMNEALASASFSARKHLEDAIVSDCKESQGFCLDSKISEVVCKEKVTTTSTEGEAAASKEAEKPKAEDKKKK